MTTALDNFLAAPVHELSLAGTTLRYRTFGDGPALLFVHGWPLSGVTYRHLIEALRPHYRCYVPDLPGAGATPWSRDIRETMQGYTAVLRAFVEKLGLEQLAIIAHDSGGGAARLLAAELGSKVKCLILQNTELPNHTPGLVRVFQLLGRVPGATAAFARLLQSRVFRRSPLGFGTCLGDQALIEGEFYKACVEPLFTDLPGHLQVLAHLDLAWTTRLDAAHAKISAPIHFFWGAADTFFPLAPAQRMAAGLKHPGLFEVVPNAKLYVHEEAPDALARFARPLLDHVFGHHEVAKGKAAAVRS
ncbi:MAG: alpha/beta hydrolase [Polyangiales bacterium]